VKLRSIAAPGWYAVELRRDGKIADTWTVEVRPIERSIEPEKPAREAAAGAPVDLAALIESALERQREMFTDELESLREELAPVKPKVEEPESVGSRLAKRLEEIALERMEKTLTGEGEKEARPSSGLSDEDELALRLIRGTDLLPKAFERITRTLGTGDEPTPKRTVGDRVLDTLESSPVLQHKAGRAFERVLDRWFPQHDGDDGDGDDGSDEEVENEIGNACSDYLMQKCAANEPVTFDDEPIKRFATELPDYWAMLLHQLKTAPIDTLIAYFSNPEQWPEWYASVLKAPHARKWLTKNLVEPAKGLDKSPSAAGK
jgi:hypothetical protein